MSPTIKIRCNGPEKHVNEIALDDALQTVTVYRGDDEPTASYTPDLLDIPQRFVLDCQHCTTGEVTLTRALLEAHLRRISPE
jgi:hypothetical protein